MAQNRGHFDFAENCFVNLSEKSVGPIWRISPLRVAMGVKCAAHRGNAAAAIGLVLLHLLCSTRMVVCHTISCNPYVVQWSARCLNVSSLAAAIARGYLIHAHWVVLSR